MENETQVLEAGTEVPEIDPEVALQQSEDEEIARMIAEDEARGSGTQVPAEGPGEQVPAGAPEGTSETIDPIAAIKARIAELEALLSAKAARKPRKVEAKANRTYKILSFVPKGWEPPPQVDALCEILKPFLGKEIKEPALFETIRQGHAAGTLDTVQDPVHIFRYYRKDMRESGMLEVRG